MPPELGFAFLGCGAATRRHSALLRRLSPAVTRFFASRFPPRAREAAEQLGGAGWFGSYEGALADPRVHAVVVATPPASHLDLVLAALAAGKHVVVEKPAFLHSGDFDLVERAAAAAGRQVLVAENYAYKPIAGLLRSVIGSGELGEIRIALLNAMKWQPLEDWRGDPAVAGGGALFEGGIHWVDLLANIGLHIESVQGFRPGDPEALERTMALVVQYEEGGVGVLLHSWEAPSALKGLRLSKITGTRGSITFESNGLFALVRARRTRLWARPGDIAGYGGMWRDFLAVLRDGHEPQMTLARAREAVVVVESAYESCGVAAAPATSPVY